MKKTSTKKIIAITALLLLAIGAGSLFTHTNALDGTVSASPMPKSHDADLAAAAKQVSVPGMGDAVSPDGKDGKSNNSSKANIYYGDKKNGGAGKNNSCQQVATHKTAHKNIRQKEAVKQEQVAENTADVSRVSGYTGLRLAPKRSIVTTVVINPVTNAPAACEDVVILESKPAKATAHKTSGIGIAPELGINLNDNKSSRFMTNGYHVGMMVNVALGDAFALQPGLEYIMKGNENKKASPAGELAGATTTTTMKFHYVELPLDVVYKFGGKPGESRVMVGAGPYVSYLADAQTQVQTTVINNEGHVASSSLYETEGTANMRRLDYGFGGFIGVQTPKGLYAKAGAELGLRDVFTTSPAMRNCNYVIGIGYILGSKNRTY